MYLGYITDEEKKYLYKHADCFVFPSLYEGFGIPVQEAINYGCPVITSNVSSLPEVIGKAGITVNPHDIDALASAMKILTTDEKVRSTLREEGYKQAKKLSNTEQIHQLLNEVLKIR